MGGVCYYRVKGRYDQLKWVVIAITGYRLQGRDGKAKGELERQKSCVYYGLYEECACLSRILTFKCCNNVYKQEL